MRKWLIKVIEGRYRCWDDFLQYKRFDGMQEPAGTVEQLTDAATETFLVSVFGS